jgi:hypothetical protein
MMSDFRQYSNSTTLQEVSNFQGLTRNTIVAQHNICNPPQTKSKPSSLIFYTLATSTCGATMSVAKNDFTSAA